MSDENNLCDEISQNLKIAFIIVVIIGIVISVPLIINAFKGEYYSYLYILPDSYTNYPENNIASFYYGVKSFENGYTDYYVDFYLEDKYLGRDEIRLFPGECIENEKSYSIDGIKRPVKLNIMLVSPYDTYQVGYWIKDPS